MNQFICPICNSALDLNEMDQLAFASSSIMRFHKQCKKCNSFLYLDPNTNTFKKLSWWKRLFNIQCCPTMESRKRTK